MNVRNSPTGYNPKNASSRPKLLSTALALGVLLLAQISTEAQANALHDDPIVGTWNVVVDIYFCDTGNPIATASQALALFNADGTRHETAASNPAMRTPGYGYWHHVKKNEYEFAFKFYRFDATGANIGSTSVRHNLVLSADKSSYYSEGIAEFLSPGGQVTFTACADAWATRYE